MEVDGVGDTSLGLKAVMPEVEPIIQYFDAWIKKITGQKNKNEKGLRTNLDILTNISPVITDPATALTFMQQLLSLAGQLDQQYLIIATLAIVEKMADKIESSNVDKIVAGVLPFYSKLIKRNVNLNYYF